MVKLVEESKGITKATTLKHLCCVSTKRNTIHEDGVEGVICVWIA